MPATPRWHADLGKIRASVAQMEAPFLDRRAIEKLFGLRARQANKLMHEFDGYRVGPSALVSRAHLLLKLDQLGPRGGVAPGSREAGVRQARIRKARVVEELDALRARSRPRPVAPPPPRLPGSALPEGAHLEAPDKLRITFVSPEDLLGRILGLAQAAAGDFAAFAAALRSESVSPGPDGQSGRESAEAEQP
jgi:hypothetical protein